MSNIVGIFSHVQPLFEPDDLRLMPRTEPLPRRPEEIPDPVSAEIEHFRRLSGMPVDQRREMFRRQIDECGPCDPFIIPDRDLSETYRSAWADVAEQPLFSRADYLWLIGAFALIVVAAAFVMYRFT